ncbi:MAG: hypothetical protein JWP66_649 [Naasia sp.]|nr:hypothetical protein [Naasia sp.]
MAAAVAVLVAGCAGGSTPDPVPTSVPTAPSTSTAAPTPTMSVDPLGGVDEVVVLPTGLELRRAGTAVQYLDYMSSSAEAVAALSRVFGAPPEEEQYTPECCHFPPQLRYSWVGFTVDEPLYDETARAEKLADWVVWPRFAVSIHASATAGVELLTGGGHRVGDSADGLDEEYPLPAGQVVCRGAAIDGSHIESPEGPPIVTVIAWTDDGTRLSGIAAPSVVGTVCA